MERDVEQAALAACHHLRHAGDRIGLELAVLEEAQAARALGDEDAAAGQEGKAPGVPEAAGEGPDPAVVLLRALDLLRQGAWRDAQRPPPRAAGKRPGESHVGQEWVTTCRTPWPR